MIVSRSAAVLLLLLLRTQGPPRAADRTMTVAAGPDRPAFRLHVLQKERHGVVEVSTPTGTPWQTLTCALEPYTDFVGGFVAEDLDLDGRPDLRGTREFGAKWERYCVWLYDPSSRRFSRDRLAEQMELLFNLKVDAGHRRLISFSIGPSRPSWDVYRIVNGPSPDERVFLPEQSCVIETAATGIVAAIVTRFGDGRAQTQRHVLPRGDQRSAQEICDGFGGAGR